MSLADLDALFATPPAPPRPPASAAPGTEGDGATGARPAGAAEPPDLAERYALASAATPDPLTPTLAEIRAAAGDDWPWLAGDLDALRAFAAIITTRRHRERGKVPPSYTATTVCRACGPVWIFPGGPPAVLACPWCLNALPGRDRIPRPPQPGAAGGGGGIPFAPGSC